jgi:hypothetical protein
MNKLKLFFKILLAFVLAILLSIVVFPLAYKAKINNIFMSRIDALVDAKITYGSYRLGLLRSFPDLTATFKNFTVVGNGTFEGDTLAAFKQLSFRVDIRSLLKGEDIVVRTIFLENALLQLIIGENGTYNWQIEKAQKKHEVEEIDSSPESFQEVKDSKEDKPIKFLLDHIELKDCDFIYHSRKSDYRFAVYNLNGNITGEFEGMNTLLTIEANTPSINYNYGKAHYLKNLPVDITTSLTADLNNYDFHFESGSSFINGMPVKVAGGFAMPSDSMLFDIVFDVPDIEMANVLNLVPAHYQKYMSGVETDGTINLNGSLVGIYYKDIYPAIDILFNIKDAWLKYPQLPDVLAIHELKARVHMPEGDYDLLTIGLTDMEVELAQNPLSMNVHFSNLFSDPHFDMAVKGKIDLETLSKVVPLGNTKLTGLLTADMLVKGNYSALETENYEQFLSKGSVQLSRFFIQNNEVPQGVNIRNAALELKNQDVSIKGLDGYMGRSDFKVTGNISNALSYMLTGGVLKGKLDWNSETINLNEFMAQYQPDNEISETYIVADTTKTENKPIVFPERVDLQFSANINRLIIDNLNITKFKGLLELRQQKLTLKGLSMDMVGGQMKLNGTMLADGRPVPNVDFKLDVINFDMPQSFSQLTIVQNICLLQPIAKGSFRQSLMFRPHWPTTLK